MLSINYYCNRKTIFFLLTLLFFVSITTYAAEKNPFLSLPEPVNQEKLLASFCNRSDDYGNFDRGIRYKHGTVILYVHYLDELPGIFTPEEKAMFTQRTIAKDGKTQSLFSYEFGTSPEDFGQHAFDPPTHLLKNIKPREFSSDQVTPQTISCQKCAEMIHQNRVVFFTGAGISSGASIHTIKTLYEDLGLDFSTSVDRFILSALHTPEELVVKILDFYRAARDGAPTPAHFSVSRLANEKSCRVLTGNFDLLHERSGIVPYRVFEEHYEKDLKNGNFREIDLVVCIGMSCDIRSFLASFKSANPQGIIISIDQKQPSYLGAEDYLVPGDIQHIIPAIEQAFWSMRDKSSINPRKRG